MELEDQLREVFESGNFPRLKCVTFEDVLEYTGSFPLSVVKRSNQMVKKLCDGAEVDFREGKIDQLSRKHNLL